MGRNHKSEELSAGAMLEGGGVGSGVGLIEVGIGGRRAGDGVVVTGGVEVGGDEGYSRIDCCCCCC